MRLIYRMLAIMTLATAAGMAHSYLAPIRTTFGEPRPKPVEGPGQQQDGAQATGAGGSGEAGAQGGGEQPGETSGPAAAPDGEIDISALDPFIGVAEAHAVWETGFVKFETLPVFLDARFPEFYQEGHITGARRLMSHEITDGSGSATVSWLVTEQPDVIVIYCEGGDCDASKNLAQQLELLGFGPDRMHVLQPGYPAWAAAHPDLVTQGAEPGGGQ
ncbi:MAG: rhodanese-like domain-containing protein [Phycisphaerales bacterium JB039]